MRSIKAVLLGAIAIFYPRALCADNNPEDDQSSSQQLNLNGISRKQQMFTAKVRHGECQKIGTTLCRLVEVSENPEAISPEQISLTNPEVQLLQFPSPDQVIVEAIFKLGSDVGNTRGYMPDDFEEIGFRTMTCNLNVCPGFAIVDKLVDLANHPKLQFIKPALKPITSAGTISRTGSVTSEGDEAMNTDTARTTFSLSGAGQTVGVISDSYDCCTSCSTNAVLDTAKGDLPSEGVLNLSDLTSGCIDEGRAMLQIVHDVAPGAALQFHTAFSTPTIFAEGILALRDAGSTVIVDDISYLTQPFFQDDVITQNVDLVASQGIPYFSSAGNSNRDAWHTDTGFVDSGFTFNGSPLHNFATDGSVDTVQSIDITFGTTYRIILQWDEPFGSVPGSASCQSNIDFHLVDTDGATVIESATDNNIGADAVEFLGFNAPGTGTYGLAITLESGAAPGYMKWHSLADLGNVEHSILSSTLVQHHNAAMGAGVGAAFWQFTPRFGKDPPVIEDFSSAGGTPLFFETDGTRLSSATDRLQPRFTGPDGGITTFFGSDNRFFGTSAAAPHVAALAALMLERNPTLTPAEIYTILEDTAIDMDDTGTPDFDVGYDRQTGYGLVEAVAAINAITATTPEPTPPPTPLPTPVPTPMPTPSSQDCVDDRPSDNSISVEISFYSNSGGGSLGDPCPSSCTGTPIKQSYYPVAALTSGQSNPCYMFPGGSGRNSFKNGVCDTANNIFNFDQWTNCDCTGTIGANKDASSTQCLVDNPNSLCLMITDYTACIASTPSPTPPPTPLPTPNPTSPTGCPAGASLFTLDLLTDRFPYDISWELINDCNPTIIYTGGGYDEISSQIIENICIAEDVADDQYTFTIFDTARDGLCCTWGFGSYSLFYRGDLVGSGAEYAASESTTFGACTAPATARPTQASPTTPQPTTRPPTPQPTRRPFETPSPTLGPTAAPTDSGSICFSEDVAVNVLGQGQVAMKDLQVGQQVFAGYQDTGMFDSNKISTPIYEKVYGFGHHNQQTFADYLRITTNASGTRPLEISGAHLIFVHGKKEPVRADSLRVGEELVHKSLNHDATTPVQITKIELISRKGLYQPLTKDGTILVDGIQASTYVSVDNLAPKVVKLGLTIFSEQTGFHWWMAPYRFVCTKVAPQLCINDYSVEEGGISHWLALGKRVLEVGEKLPTWLLLIYVTVLLACCGSIMFLDSLLEGDIWTLSIVVFGFGASCFWSVRRRVAVKAKVE